MEDAFDDIYIAQDPAQRKALTSPLRLEMIEHFLHGPMTVAELAARMGRRPDSLYYHVRTLVDVGLLLPAGTRKRGKRDEAIYKPVAPAIALGGEAGDTSFLEDASKTLSAGLRMVEREMRDALESNRLSPEGEPRNNWCVRQRCRLRPAARTSIIRHLTSIQKVIDREFARQPRADDDATMCSFTVALIPLEDPEPQS